MNKQQIELETKIAFLEQHLNELSDVVYEQQKMIDVLEKKHQQLIERLLAGEENAPHTEDTRPPHY